MAKQQVHDDWRWQGTTLAAPFRTGGRVLPAGEVVRTMLPVTLSGKDAHLPIPNVAASLFHLAREHWQAAAALRQQLSKDTDLLKTRPSDCMDLFQYVMACAVLAYGSLEAFTNLLIPNEAQWTKRKKRGIFSVLFKPTIERESTEAKLGGALPQLLGYESPKGKQTWERFKLLKGHRDRIVHCKSEDQVPDVTAKHLWGIWIESRCPDYPLIAWEMIDYVSSRIDNSPLWVKQFAHAERMTP